MMLVGIKLLLIHGADDNNKTAIQLAKTKEIANLIMHFGEIQRNIYNQCTLHVQTNCLIEFQSKLS